MDNTQRANSAYELKDKPFVNHDKVPVTPHPEGTVTRAIKRTFPSPNGTIINVTQEHTYPDGTVYGTRGSTPGKWPLRWERPDTSGSNKAIELSGKARVTASACKEIDPEWLRREYVDKEKSLRALSIALGGVSRSTIRNALEANGIPIRTRGQRTRYVSKLTTDDVREIRQRRAAGETLDSLAKEFGVTGATISRRAKNA